MRKALLDTSTVIQGLGRLRFGDGADLAISVITIGELVAGVRLARKATVRAARQARLHAIREAFDPIPIDERTAERYGEALAAARSAGRITKATDLLIVATAAATGRLLLTGDRGQAALAAELTLPVELTS